MTNPDIPKASEPSNELIVRDFSQESINDLVQPPSALTISAERLRYQDAFTASEQSQKAMTGRVSQLRSMQGRKRTNGGWKSIPMKGK